MILIFAGSSFIFGHSEIRRACEKHGWQALFVEAPFIKRYGFMSENRDQVTFDDLLYSDNFEEIEKFALGRDSGTYRSQDGKLILVPLSEYWISRCGELSAASGKSGLPAEMPSDCSTERAVSLQPGTGTTALRASRSKAFLYHTLSVAGIPVPATYQNLSAARSAIAAGHSVVVKPDGLFSGYGVEIVGPSNAGDLELHVKKAAGLKNNATKLFRVESDDVLLSEYIAGTEYSADCWICNGTVTVVRVCRKVMTVINDKPCTVAVEYIPVPEGHRQQLELWCRTLFAGGDISFAQFDYIERNHVSRGAEATVSVPLLVPIDFACRIGGGMKTLLNTMTDSNGSWHCCYAAAMAEMPLNPVSAEGQHPVQFNVLTTTSGYLTTDVSTLPVAVSAPNAGHLTIYKHPGDYVTSNPSSAASRLADFVTWTIQPPDNETISHFILGTEHICREKTNFSK